MEKGWKPPSIKTTFEEYLLNKIKKMRKAKRDRGLTLKARIDELVKRKVTDAIEKNMDDLDNCDDKDDDKT